MRHFGLVLFCIFFTFAITVSSQERLRSAKVAYLSERLSLTPTEAESFWPIYNEMAAKQKELRKNENRLDRNNELSDAEARVIIEEFFNDQKAGLEIKEEYYGKMEKVIGPKKIIRLYRAEKKFNKLLLEQMRSQRRRNGR